MDVITQISAYSYSGEWHRLDCWQWRPREDLNSGRIERTFLETLKHCTLD